MRKSMLITPVLILTTIGATTYYTARRKCNGSKNCNACKIANTANTALKTVELMGCVNNKTNEYINQKVV